VEDTVRREVREETGLEVTKFKRVSPPLFSTSGLSDEAAAMAFVDVQGPADAKPTPEASEVIEVLLLDFAQVCRLCDDAGIDRPAVSSPLYNIANRQVETEVLPVCDFYGVGVIPYSPLARSVLTGKYVPGQQPDTESRVGRGDMRVMMNEWRPESVELAVRIKAYAEARGFTASQFAVAWVLNNRLVTGVIAGPRTLEQWDDYRAALDYPFTPEDEEFVNSLVPPGGQSSPGHTDPYFPVEGRVPRTAPPREPGWCNEIRDGLRTKSLAARS